LLLSSLLREKERKKKGHVTNILQLFHHQILTNIEVEKKNKEEEERKRRRRRRRKQRTKKK
jgi:hypothetical protein